MLDENLPTFRLKPSSDNPLSTILYLTQNGSDPSAEYVLRRPDPALPASHNKYGIALCDPYNQDVIYGEVLVEPELSQPTLSAAEIRAQAQAGVVAAPVTATVPDSFAIQLYNPDQSVAMKMAAGTWGKSDSWEFEIPVQTFRTPTTSQLDREQQDNSLVETDLIPHIMFRWKRDGKLSKDMTCYMTGTNTAGRKSKEPDITIAMYKAAKEGAVTIYQPNLHRVELEDRKGLEIVLLLSAEVIKDLYLSPKPSMFNVQAGGPVLNKRKNSRPNNAVASAATGAVAAAAMSGALNNAPPPKTSTIPTPPLATVGASNIAPTGPKPHLKPAVAFTSTPTANIDAETRRLQEMVEREKHEREKTERAEQKRIKKMLEEEEKERRRREAEIAKETERLRKKYGVEGQDLPSDRPSLPPRPQAQAQQPPKIQPSPPPLAPQFPPPPDAPAHGPSWLGAPPPTLPPRPVSAGPYSRPSGTSPQPEQGPFHCNKLNVLWKGAAGQLQQIQHQVVSAYQLQQQQGGGPSTRPGRRRSDEERQKVQRKRSSHW